MISPWPLILAWAQSSSSRLIVTDRSRLGVDHPPIAGILPRGRIRRIVGDVLRELVEHRQHRALGPAVSDGARQPSARHRNAPRGGSSDWVVMNTRKPLGVGQQPPPQLADDPLGRRYLGDLVQLVEQHAGGLHPGQNRGVERLDLQRRLGPRGR